MAADRFNWIADHPPLSNTDKWMRAELKNASSIKIAGDGKRWRQLTGLQDDEGFVVRDRTIAHEVAHEITEALRVTDCISLACQGIGALESNISVDVESFSPKTHQCPGLAYYSFDKGECAVIKAGASLNSGTVVQPRFGLHFEGLIAQLAQEAKAPGDHPKIVLDRHSF